VSILDLSIVLPVYNTASYLRRCLDSLAAQAALPKEIIAIDDGSTDESKTILVEYAANRTKKTMACLPHAIQGFD
jgi:glycosyltransferase involved in cell wall biosynthesis